MRTAILVPNSGRITIQRSRRLHGIAQIVPVGLRPESYNTLGVKRLEAARIGWLGAMGRAFYDSIVEHNVDALEEPCPCLRA